jgi:hypothetical protein
VPALQALSQQYPVTQNAEAQADAVVHGWPFARPQLPVGPHNFGETQESGSTALVTAAQIPGLAAVLQL